MSNNKILTTKQHLFINHYISNNHNGLQAAKAAGYKGNDKQLATIANQNLNKIYIADEIRQREVDIKASIKIDVVTMQRKLMYIVDDILSIKDDTERRKLYHKVVPACNSLIKTIGGFQADKLPEESLVGKMLDAKKAEDMRKIADLYYANKYLAEQAVKQVESSMIEDVNSGQPEDDSSLHDVSDDLTDGIPFEFQIQDEISQSDTHDPPEGRA